MIAFLLYTFAILAANEVRAKKLPSPTEVEASINRTINEVERLIGENASLPRLSRKEIVNILHNITSRDTQSYGDKETIEKARKMYQRALMVVLPYEVKGSAGNLNDLYTKAPIVRIISDSSNGTFTKEENAAKSTDALNLQDFAGSSEKERKVLSETRYKNHRETYADVEPQESLRKGLKSENAPVKFSFNLQNLQKDFYSGEKRGANGNGGKMKFAGGEETNDSKKQNVLSSDQWRYNAPPPPPSPLAAQKGEEKTEKIVVDEEEEEGEEIANSQIAAAPVYVTPMTTTSMQKSGHNSSYSINSGGFRSDYNATEPMRQEVMDLLASIGLKPKDSSNMADIVTRNEELTKSKSQIFATSNVVSPTISSPTLTSDALASISSENTLQQSHFDVKKGVENMPLDVQSLFHKFGIQIPRESANVTATSTSAPIRTSSYTKFKPLPTGSSIKDEELKEFLAKFGLTNNEERKRKAIKNQSESASVIEAVPDDMKRILENIGLLTISHKSAKNIAQTSTEKSVEEMEAPEIHIFKPHESLAKNSDQEQKISELIDTVRRVREKGTTVKDVRKVAADLLRITKMLRSGPDPVTFEEIVKTYNEDLKREVKREEEDEEMTEADKETTTNSMTTTFTSTTETAQSKSTETTTSATTTTTEANSTASTNSPTSLLDLEGSFAGNTEQPEVVSSTTKKNGLYFLVDWNTFLEVGEDEKEKVNLRFQPKVGDRSRFIPVVIP